MQYSNGLRLFSFCTKVKKLIIAFGNKRIVKVAIIKSLISNLDSNDFIQKNLTSDIDELGMLNDVLKEIIADNEQEIAGDENQD